MTVLNVGIVASEDDAFEDGAGTVNINGTVMGIVDGVNEWLGMRFRNVTIPPGSVINSAILSMMPASTGNDEPDHPFWAEAADNAAVFTTGANDISARAPTTATVTWTSTNLGADGATYFDLPDVAALVQEVVDRGGWVSGNAIVIFGHGSANAARDLNVFAWDWDNGGGRAPKIVIDYTAAGSSQAPRTFHQLQMHRRMAS